MKNVGATMKPSGSRNPAGARDHTSLKHTFAGLAGASIEWYDFLLYATAAAVVFPTVFFPSGLSTLVALSASFSTFAVGFVARPIGAILFGYLGDRVGRKVAFAVALITMGSATTLIGCLPSYSTAGVLAPLALVLLRLTQGFAVGGQWGGAVLLATESAPEGKRGFYGSIAQIGLPAGVVLANLALLIANGSMSHAAFMAYGWRIPFLFSVVLIVLGLFIHFRVEETAADRELRQAKPAPADAEASATTPVRRQGSPVFQAALLYPKTILLAGAANIGVAIAFYILITYVVAYGTSASGLQLPQSAMITAVLIAQVIFIPCIIFSGMLSDRFGRWRIYMIGTVLTAIWTFAFFPMVETRSLVLITAAISIGLALFSLSYGPTAAMYAELYDARVRYSAVSLSYQLSSIVGGGFGPIIATALFAHYHSNFAVSVFIAGACVMSLVCATRLCNRPQHPTVG